jgi:hypothetical protein
VNTPNLHTLARACWNGASNPLGIIRSLAEAIGEIPPGYCKESLDLKIILGQLSFLVGESLGPSEQAATEFAKTLEGEQ